MSELAARVAIVTGAAQGLGYGIAAALATAGHRIAVFDLDAAASEGAAQRLTGERGAIALGLACDVRDREAVQRAVDEVVERWGRLDALVNNAQETRIASVLDTDDETAEAVWRSGFVGTLHCMQVAHPYLAATGGAVVNLASGAGLSADPGYAVYGATKEAIRTLTRVAAREWGPDGVRVNAISPSARTPAFDRWQVEHPEEAAARIARIPLARLGDAELDIGAAVVFLTGPSATYITGTTLVIDGGVHHLR
jgi:NAD(P)-dependent dehydrogenase (short-subunit alcohol dehydrogenase family)